MWTLSPEVRVVYLEGYLFDPPEAKAFVKSGPHCARDRRQGLGSPSRIRFVLIATGTLS